MKINSKIERLIMQRAEIAEKEHRIISAKDCARDTIFFYEFEKMQLDDDMDIEDVKHEIDKVINKLSKADTLCLLLRWGKYFDHIPRYLQNDKEITIEEYHKNGEDCLYKTEEEYPGINNKIYRFKRNREITHTFMEVVYKAIEDHKIISEYECYVGEYVPFFEKLIDIDNGLDIEEIKNKMEEVIDKIFILYMKDLNNKKSKYRSHIPLELQTDEEVKIEDYQKDGEKCFYKNIEDYPEM